MYFIKKQHFLSLILFESLLSIQIDGSLSVLIYWSSLIISLLLELVNIGGWPVWRTFYYL